MIGRWLRCYFTRRHRPHHSCLQYWGLLSFSLCLVAFMFLIVSSSTRHALFYLFLSSFKLTTLLFFLVLFQSPLRIAFVFSLSAFSSGFNIIYSKLVTLDAFNHCHHGFHIRTIYQNCMELVALPRFRTSGLKINLSMLSVPLTTVTFFQFFTHIAQHSCICTTLQPIGPTYMLSLLTTCYTGKYNSLQ